MNETTKHDLARRATAAMQRLGLEMRPGMRATWSDDSRPARRYGEPGETGGWVSDYSGKERDRTDDDALPDLDDAPTRACVLELVREAHNNPEIFLEPFYSAHVGRRIWGAVEPNAGDYIGRGATEAEALVAALEAAGGAS